MTHDNRLKPHDVHNSVAYLPLFLNKWHFWWSTSITIENKKVVLIDFWPGSGLPARSVQNIVLGAVKI